ncbi:hypothetical protein EVAR_50007_1 [Eumeta japonica]|uniref:Uncharacterized protein n=1 Tax=Eumeta variegata TaxID=151549 RepID=A0A4C1XPW2_EUMVA|nr:hypothetical protein EVAR_50007_1 [Eumeta japonica]
MHTSRCEAQAHYLPEEIVDRQCWNAVTAPPNPAGHTSGPTACDMPYGVNLYPPGTELPTQLVNDPLEVE